MEKTEKAKESLLATLSTISNCDNKAGALLTAVGIVFGFSMFSIENLIKKPCSTQIAIYVIGSLYLLDFVAIITILVLIVFPRRRIKKEKSRAIEYPLYPEDLFKHLNEGDVEEFVLQEYKEDAILDQVKNCTRIAHTKENLLRASVVLIIVFAFLLIGLVVCMFC